MIILPSIETGGPEALISPKRNQDFLVKWLIPLLEPKEYTVNLEYYFVPESEAVLRQSW